MGSAYIRVRFSLEHACWCMAFYQEHESRTCIVGQHSCEPARNSREEFFKTWSNFNAEHIIQSNLDAITFKNNILCLQINSSSDGLVITGVPRWLLQIYPLFFLEKDRSFSSLCYLVILDVFDQFLTIAFFKMHNLFTSQPHFLVSSRSISRTAVCTKTESFFGLDFKQAIHVFIISFSQSCIDLDWELLTS